MPKKSTQKTRLRQTTLTGLRSAKKRKGNEPQKKEKSATPVLDSPKETPASSATEDDELFMPIQAPDKESVDKVLARQKVSAEARPRSIKIHQESMTETDKLLRAFDLNYAYGPCVGLTRLQRWERASKLGLNPPGEVKEALKNHGDMACLFEE